MSDRLQRVASPPLEKGGEGGFIGGGELIAAGRNPPRPPFCKGGRRPPIPRPPFFKGGSVGSFAEVKHVRRP